MKENEPALHGNLVPDGVKREREAIMPTRAAQDQLD
jgi:hypothetical protein